MFGESERGREKRNDALPAGGNPNPKRKKGRTSLTRRDFVQFKKGGKELHLS